MRILVAYGSTHGGTKGIAEQIAAALEREGLTADVRAAGHVRDVAPYDAVILGGALYALHWQADARRFVLHHHAALRAREVYFFSSGPLDDSASRTAIPPTHEVAQLMAYVGARGHATFGGRLAPDAKGFPAAAMAKTKAGDYRDPSRIEAWTREVAAALTAPHAPHAPAVPLPSRSVSLALALLLALLAPAGGAALFVLAGLPAAWAAWRHAIRDPYAGFVSALVGVELTVWMLVASLLDGASALTVGYLALGIAITLEAAVRVRATMREWSALAPERAATPVEIDSHPKSA